MNKVELEPIRNLIQSSIPTIIMTRASYQGKRAYIQDDPFRVYSGLTGALSAATFKGNMDNKRLEKWRDTMVNKLGSIEAQEAYLNSMSDYGTAVHEALVRIKMDGKLNWAYERDYAHEYFVRSAHKNGLVPMMGVIEKQVFEYCKSIASLMHFVFENVTEILAIESMAKSDVLQISTPIDVVAKLKTGDTASINIKTSNAVGDHQLEQVVLEKLLWNTTYPDYRVQKTGVFRSKDWMIKKGIPTYEMVFVNPEDEKKILEDAVGRLKMCLNSEKSTYANFPSYVQIFEGETKAGEMPRIVMRTIEQLYRESAEAKSKPENNIAYTQSN